MPYDSKKMEEKEAFGGRAIWCPACKKVSTFNEVHQGYTMKYKCNYCGEFDNGDFTSGSQITERIVHLKQCPGCQKVISWLGTYHKAISYMNYHAGKAGIFCDCGNIIWLSVYAAEYPEEGD